MTQGAISVFIEGKAQYIQGGFVTSSDVSEFQTFFIDLSVPWPVTNPVYIRLANGPMVFRSPNALLNDGETWVSIANNTIRTYNIKNGTLVSKEVLTAVGTDAFIETGAVVNTESGEVIAVRRSGGANGVRGTLFSEATNTTTGLTVYAIGPPPDYATYHSYSMVWSNRHKAAFAFGGGSHMGTFMDTVWRLDVSTYAWTKLPTIGEVPPARDSSCMVAAQGGEKLVVFGGRVSGSFGSDVYVYEIANNSWKKGKDGGIPRAKMDHVCAMSGTKLVVWGGWGTGAGVTAVYDIATDAWLDQYTPPLVSDLIPESETTPPAGPGSESKSGVAAIAGGACGAIAVVTIISGILIYRRQRKNTSLSQQNHHVIDKESAFKMAGYLFDPAHKNKSDHPEFRASKPGSPESCPEDMFTVASKKTTSMGSMGIMEPTI
ncbi:hypothetical protein BG004_000323 [Podila humilis]|nr:hypothetical protein BG004_000323 [Podila humilis]